MTEVAWSPTTQSDTLRLLWSRGASQAILSAVGRVRKQRGAIEELRSEAKPPLPWLTSRPSQIAVFYALLANWYSDRETICEAHGVDYRGQQ